MTKHVMRKAAASVLAGLFVFVVVSPSLAVQTTQNFDTNPADWVFSPTNPDTFWEGDSLILTDYGYRDSNFAGGANPGEAGGVIDRRKRVGAPRATYYAGQVSGLNGNTPFHASGRFGWDEIESFNSQNAGQCTAVNCSDLGAWRFGWFSGGNEYAMTQDPADLPGYWGVENETFPGGSGTDNRYHPSAGLVFGYSSTNFFLWAFGPGGASNFGEIAQEVLFTPILIPSIEGCVGNNPSTRNCDGATGGKSFDLTYDPNAGDFGVFSAVVTDANNVTYSATMNLTEYVRNNLNVKELNRFGLGRDHPGAEDDSIGDRRATRVWFDDLNYTSDPTIPPGVPGDYNGNGEVDAADYVVWRDGGSLLNEVETIGTTGPEDYDAWRARFGNTSGSGSGIDASAVPEPASALLLAIGMFGLGVCRRG